MSETTAANNRKGSIMDENIDGKNKRKEADLNGETALGDSEHSVSMDRRSFLPINIGCGWRVGVPFVLGVQWPIGSDAESTHW